MARSPALVLATPLHWWRSSLTLRVVTLAMVGSLLAVIGAGLFLLHRVTDGIVERAQEAAVTDAKQALQEIEQSLQTAGFEPVPSSTAISTAAYEAIGRGAVGQRYEVWIRTDVADLLTPGLSRGSFPDELLLKVAAEPTLIHWTPTTVRSTGTSAVTPGLAVGAVVTAGVEVYFVFPLTQEAMTLGVIRTALLVAGLVVVISIAVVSFFVARQTLRPLRQASQAAGRLAAGELAQPMPVRGTDDLARLAVSMNHMANQLQLRIRELQQLSRVQQRFVSDVSHELRTPLTTVRMAADLLYESRAAFPEIEQRSAELLRREVDRFEALLADLLEISRFDAGAAQLSLDDSDIVELVRAETTALAQLSAARGTEIRFHHGPPTLAQVDVRRIARLVRNLLSNAIEHGEARPIDVTVAADDAFVAIAVRDHGVGFTADEAKQLFNRFWRADPARTRRIGGTGLGLAISQEDVHLHQGWIHAWGRPGQGAQFRVTLPRRAGEVVTRSPLPLVPLDIDDRLPSAPRSRRRQVQGTAGASPPDPDLAGRPDLPDLDPADQPDQDPPDRGPAEEVSR